MLTPGPNSYPRNELRTIIREITCVARNRITMLAHRKSLVSLLDVLQGERLKTT